MQFTLLASISLLFVGQALAVPSPQGGPIIYRCHPPTVATAHLLTTAVVLTEMPTGLADTAAHQAYCAFAECHRRGY
ncbi:hypothetical protein CVT25_005261 [Psilocybe cyanescens]|uniref:Uncharacterized protein n=1 Tax=Psilocybe cyanescens TaxID=93625 RepID=A0A409WX27_PSICY|nr:hypothetical protein CVT25_005261 [Psilocybe cyanescens]